MHHVPFIATEIEFYLFGSEGSDFGVFWAAVRAACDEAGIGIFKIEKETGTEQHEVALMHTRNIAKIIADTEQLKIILSERAAAQGMRADFSAKPLAEEPGSGLHIHVHLEDAAGRNLFYKDEHGMSDALVHSIAGLLATMPEYMPVFLPTAESKNRLVAGSNAPTTISWGANNRTVAVRLPDTGTQFRRIEHRVAGADADVGAVIKAVLAGIEYGLEHKLMPPAQVYGDAGLAMYGLPPLA